MKKLIFLCLILCYSSYGASVFVNSAQTEWAGDGTVTSPYGTIQSAFAALWSTPGDHTITIAAGTYTGEKIGKNPYGIGLIDFFDGGGNDVIPSTSRATNTFQVVASGSVIISRNTDSGDSEFTPRGLFSVGCTDVSDITIRDITILLEANNVSLVGYVWADLANEQGITFSNCSVYVISDCVTLYNGNIDAFDTRDIDFIDSNIYFNTNSVNNIYLFGFVGGLYEWDPTGTIWDEDTIALQNTSLWMYDGVGDPYVSGSYGTFTNLNILGATLIVTNQFEGKASCSSTNLVMNGSNSLGGNVNSIFFLGVYVAPILCGEGPIIQP